MPALVDAPKQRSTGHGLVGWLTYRCAIGPRPQIRLVRLVWQASFAAAFILLCAGCAGYKLGPTNGERAGTHSVQVKPFLNQTTEPRLSASVTASLRKSVQQDGTYRLESDDSADIVVTGAVIEYERSHISFEPKDIITPRDYRIVMRAQVKATERATGKVLLNREVVGRTTVRVGADLTSAERQAIPLLADDLARRATAFLVDGTW